MKKKTLCVFLLAFVMTFFSATVVCAEYHHVDSCLVCHNMFGESSNLALIWEVIETPNSGDKAVIFLDRTGANSFADGDETYEGVCEVCHTDTNHHRNDGSNPDPDPHYAGTDCIDCHAHRNEFSHGGGAGVGCEACHGHDAGYEYQPGEFSEGAGTVKSHSTHTEDDSDDLKGPDIACGDCHDTAKYPFFKSGTGNAPYDLSETDVCDACHSPDGAFDGVLIAKANWDEGVYEADGETLKSGKETWCAACHDDEPAFSKAQPIEVIVDNPEGTYTGAWDTSTYAPGYYGDNYQYHRAGSGTDTFTWTPVITNPGTYTVYARWTSDPSRAPDATYTIHHDDGTTPVVVDQRSNGGSWFFLGTFSFDGTGDRVELSENANGYVIADAIKFESGGQGTYAPNVLGDNTTYGFYVTGHKINCLSCHSAIKNHIDGAHRTYDAGVTPYSDSYRLKEIDGQPAMNLPRPTYPPNTDPLLHGDDFALCFDCHNRYEVLSETPGDVSNTNFWNEDASIGNSHNIHLGIGWSHFDSDWDGVAESTESCIACHNVHGSPTKVMIRHGELISTPDTTDKVPALNFGYQVPCTEATAIWSAPAGDYYVYARWSQDTGDYYSHSSKYIVNYNGGSSSFEQTENQHVNSGQWNQLGSGTYHFTTTDSVVLSCEGAEGYLIADAVGWDSDGAFEDDWDSDGILDPEVVVDNNAASYLPAIWPNSDYAPGYHGDDYQYLDPKTPDPEATVEQSVGGKMSYAGAVISQNGVCRACHGPIAYSRPPFLGPNVLSPDADPGTVSPDGVTKVLFTVATLDHDDNLDSVMIDLSTIGGSSTQAMFDDGTNGDNQADDGIYSYQITIPVSTDTGMHYLLVTATDDDALTSENTILLMVTIPGVIIVDNLDEGASYTGVWLTSSWAPGYYGTNYHYHKPGTVGGDDTFTWTPTITTSGQYEVFARWTSDPNRAPDATYTVYHDAGNTLVPVDQRTNGGQWNSLGIYTFDGTNDYVELVENSGTNAYVVADAIKCVLQ